MRSGKLLLFSLPFMLLSACGGGDGGTPVTPTVPAEGSNVVAVNVNGSGCSDSFPNKACVSVTICTPGTTTCQTVNDILLDTGSFGLRVFKQALTVSLPTVSTSSGTLAECAMFGDGSSMWGPIVTAGIILGGEPAVQVPMQLVDSTFGTRPAACLNADKTPADAGFNGILGVGLFQFDCGSACEDSATAGFYFSCNGSGCTGATVSRTNQVQNPVALLPLDNNGVMVQLPGVSTGGAPSVKGSLILGIGTRTNNTPSGVTTFPANQMAEFTTVFNGNTLPGFIDSGSNGLFFPAFSSGVLPLCPSPNSVWYCPSATTTLSANIVGATGSPSSDVPFQIGNLVSLVNSSNRVFNDIGGPSPGGDFDWGLPFFLGRNVFVGLSGKDSPLGTGPYWAF